MGKYTSALARLKGLDRSVSRGVVVPVFDPTQAFGGKLYDKDTNTWSPKPGTRQEHDVSESSPRFDGNTYDHKQDHARLTSQLTRVYDVIKDGRWHTLSSIANITGDPEGSVSARLRDLRKEKFGAYDIQRTRRGNVFSYTCAGRQSDNIGQGPLF